MSNTLRTWFLHRSCNTDATTTTTTTTTHHHHHHHDCEILSSHSSVAEDLSLVRHCSVSTGKQLLIISMDCRASSPSGSSCLTLDPSKMFISTFVLHMATIPGRPTSEQTCIFHVQISKCGQHEACIHKSISFVI